MAEEAFTTDDVVLAIEIPGVYDGTCCWLLRDGRIVSRFAGGPRAAATQRWIDDFGDVIRADHADERKGCADA